MSQQLTAAGASVASISPDGRPPFPAWYCPACDFQNTGVLFPKCEACENRLDNQGHDMVKEFREKLKMVMVEVFGEEVRGALRQRPAAGWVVRAGHSVVGAWMSLQVTEEMKKNMAREAADAQNKRRRLAKRKKKATGGWVTRVKGGQEVVPVGE